MTVQSKLGYWFLDFTIKAGMFDNSFDIVQLGKIGRFFST